MYEDNNHSKTLKRRDLVVSGLKPTACTKSLHFYGGVQWSPMAQAVVSWESPSGWAHLSPNIHYHRERLLDDAKKSTERVRFSKCSGTLVVPEWPPSHLLRTNRVMGGSVVVVFYRLWSLNVRKRYHNWGCGVLTERATWLWVLQRSNFE